MTLRYSSESNTDKKHTYVVKYFAPIFVLLLFIMVNIRITRFNTPYTAPDTKTIRLLKTRKSLQRDNARDEINLTHLCLCKYEYQC